MDYRNDYERWKEFETSVLLAIKVLKEKRQTLEWSDNVEEAVKPYDKAIRELQLYLEQFK